MPRLSAVFVLSICLFSAFLLACGGSAAPAPTNIPEPTPNIEATVEARIQAELSANPTPASVPTNTLVTMPTSAPMLEPTSIPTLEVTPALVPTPTVAPTFEPTSTPPPTQEPVAVEMTVMDYAAKWCDGQSSDSNEEITNKEALERVDSRLKDAREIVPPSELEPYHAAEINVLTAIRSSLSLEPSEEIFNPFSLFAVALVVGTVIEQAESELSAETYSVLVAAGCIEEDTPEPTPTPDPTSTPEPTPADPGLSATNPVEVGGTLDGTDGTKIVVLSTVGDAWALIESESTSSYSTASPPKEGHRFYLISLQVAYASGSGSIGVSSSDFSLLDYSLVLIKTGCRGGYRNNVPNELSGEIFVGGKIAGNICFEVREEASEFILIHQPGYSAESRRFLRVE